jgi:hypothetical protein
MEDIRQFHVPAALSLGNKKKSATYPTKGWESSRKQQ